jgi:hypothetical protein
MTKNSLLRLALLLTSVALLASPMWAQVRIAGSISGTITDPTGALVPNAKVELKDEATGITKSVTANGQGEFLFPDLNFGSYEVSVSVSGFRTERITHVKVQASRVTDVSVRLSVGQNTETVTVEGVAPLLETSSNLISKTIEAEAVKDLPINGRGTLGLARLVPGQQTPLGNGDTHYNGLPGGAVNVTTDGINNASNGFKSGGTVFFQTVPARLGAVEEIAVETGGLGAESGAESGVNLKFITKRGTDHYHGTLYWQPTSSQFNSNSWLRNAQGIPTPKVRVHDFGGGIGGPLIPISKWGLKNKLFFFVNLEETYQPQLTTHSFNYLNAAAQQGTFTYRASSGPNNGTIQTANVLQIGASKGFQGTIDSTIASYILAHQNQALANGVLTPINNNFNQQLFTFLTPENLWSYFPTARLDYQATSKLAIQGTWNLRHFRDPGFPQTPISGAPNQSQFLVAGYWLYSVGVNYAFTPRTLNEFRYGVQHSGDVIPGSNTKLYDIGGGRLLRMTLPLGTPSLVLDQSTVTGRHYITTIYDTATLIRGTHTFTVGGNYRSTDWKDIAQAGPVGILGVPRYNIGNQNADPINSAFTGGTAVGATLPGASPTDVTNARLLYDLLTSRMNTVVDGAVVNPNTLQYGGPENVTWTRSYMGGFYGQDSWRLRPNLTLNYGLRWEMQGAPYNVSGITAFPDIANFFGPSVGLFQPGTLSGNNDPLNLVNHHVAEARLNNLGPNLGFAWNPRSEKGFREKLFGRSTVLRGGFGIVYYDEGTQMFAAGAGNNPGKLQNLTLTAGQNGVPFGLTLQSPLPAAFTAFPGAYATTFHQADFTFGNTFQTMAPNLRTPYSENWNFGIQREIIKDTVLEVRYVGNASHSGWRRIDYNEVNIFENGFLKEFQNAQNNLNINNNNGFPNTFQFKGLPGQVPLPIFDAAFGARGTCGANCAAILGNYTNGTFIGQLQQGQAGALANALATSSTFACRMFGSNLSPCLNKLGVNAPGPYPINFFLTNPFSAGSLLLTEDSGATNYNGMQVNLRGHRGTGFNYVANYTWSHSFSNIWGDNANNDGAIKTIRNKALDMQPSLFDQRHVFNFYSLYDIPVGKNKLLNISNPILNTFVGGWKLSGIFTVASGSPFRLGSGFLTVNGNDGGVVLAPGVTKDQIQNAMRISQVPGSTNRYWLPPSMIGSNGQANTSFFLTPAPGTFGDYLFLYGRNNWNIDSAIEKNFSITEKWKLNLWMSALNVLNHPIWNPNPNNPPSLTLTTTSPTFGQMTAPANGARVLQFRALVSF